MLPFRAWLAPHSTGQASHAESFGVFTTQYIKGATCFDYTMLGLFLCLAYHLGA